MSTAASVIGPTWIDGDPPVRDRVVVLAPHPDDEVLGTGGLLRWLAGRGIPTTVVAVTDGEASHARSELITPATLRRVRAEEREAALAALGVEPSLVRLGLPDGAVTAHRAALTEAIGGLVDAGTTVVAPWRVDGHPDHEAVGHAAAIAVEHRGSALWEVSIWGKVRRPLAAGIGARQLVLDAATDDAKRAAAACFATQLHALGPDPEDGPVVHPDEVAALLDGPELVRVG